MCDFHSIIVRTDGKTAHTTANSHSGAAADAGWRENTDQRTYFVECEWDGIGEYSLDRVVCLRNGLKLEDLTNKQVKAINRHYKALFNVMAGDIKAIQPGGLLHGLEYWDVYLKALHSANTSATDGAWIKKELITVTVGDDTTVAGGDYATIIGGHRATIIGGHRATVTGGDYATVAGGDYATVIGGNGATVTGGNGATVTGGCRATVTGRYGATVTGGDDTTVTGGCRATVTGGFRATVTGGDKATVTGGDHATVIGGANATVVGGYGATVTGGENTIISLSTNPDVRKVTLVDGVRIKENIPYRLDENNEFVEA